MSANPYDDQTYSGTQGSQTPLAVQSQIGTPQPKPISSAASTSPYEAILAHALGTDNPGAAALGSGPSTQAVPNMGDSPANGLPLTGGNGDAGGTPPPANSTPAAPSSGRMRPSAPPPVYSDANPPTHPPPGASLNDLVNYYRAFQYKNPAFGNITGQDVLAYWRDPKGMTIGDWYLAGNRGISEDAPNPLDGTGMGDAPTSPPPGGAQPPPDGAPGADAGASNPAPPPSSAPPVGYGPQTQAQAPQPPTAPPGPPPAAQSPMDWQSILAQLQQMMSPQFNFESDQLNRKLNAQAALSGDMNSGGYGDVNARANAQLSADQGNRLSGMLNTDWQNELARALQQYGINTTSGDTRYTADRGVDAAALHANAASAAAGAGLQGTLAGIAQQETESKRQWDEYWGNLGLGARGQDLSLFSQLLGGLSSNSPEALNGAALGNGQFPGFAYFPGIDWTKYFNLGKP